MSAALQLPILWAAAATARPLWPMPDGREEEPAANLPEVELPEIAFAEDAEDAESEVRPHTSLAFYRSHTESMLRRYLYASTQVGRAPSILGEPVGRGWVSSRKVRTFEDAVIFVLDVENCLKKLGPLDRALLSRIVLQEYTQAETAALLGMSARAVHYKFRQALDRMTECLLDADLLDLPH
jgi:DNA-directed RNA polymerase specialized sigma24 family protein